MVRLRVDVAVIPSWFSILRCQISLTLHWCSPLSSPSRHTNSHWVLNNCTLYASGLFWQPVYRFYVLSIEFKIFKTSQFLSDHYTRHGHAEWHRSIAYQRFRRGIYSIETHALVLDIYSSMFWPFDIQFVLLGFDDVRYAIFNFLTMCRRSQKSVMLVAAWINAAWRMTFIRVLDVLGLLVRWVVWHHEGELCS